VALGSPSSRRLPRPTGAVALFEFEENADNARTSETASAPFVEKDGRACRHGDSQDGSYAVATTGEPTARSTSTARSASRKADHQRVGLRDDDLLTSSDKAMLLACKRRMGRLRTALSLRREQTSVPKSYKPGLCVTQAVTGTLTCQTGGTSFQKTPG